MRLAERADEAIQGLQAIPPKEGSQERQEYDVECAQLRRAFQVEGQAIPKGIFTQKVETWMEKVKDISREHLYHACSTPGCGMENWILRTDFEINYRAHGFYTWTCKKGHSNTILPSQQEIDSMNRNILLHPEHYTRQCGHDSLALRRFRLCPECVREGLLTFAVHESGCKQWPGSRAGHRHCFCFRCTKIWGKECNHSTICEDPGIQQVRKAVGSDGKQIIEIGYVNAEQYIAWVGRGKTCPPTIFRKGQRGQEVLVRGETRQGQLGLEDKEKLLRTMNEGTT
jgi:hypothetical protein